MPRSILDLQSSTSLRHEGHGARYILLCSRLVVRPNWTCRDHRFWTCFEHSETWSSCWHYSLKKPEFVKVVLEYKPQESQTHLVLSTHLNPSELKHETYLSLRSTSNQTSVKPQPTNVRSHPKWDARLDTKNQRCEMLRLGIGAQLYRSR